MHPNPAFAWTDREDILGFFRQAGFERIFGQTATGPHVAHVPVLVRPGPALHFHLAKGNALAGQIAGATALAVAEGPNGYLSANWYADPKGAVPTWNYVAAECLGPVQPLERTALIALVDDLARHLEPKVGEDWTRAKMDPARFAAMLKAIRGFAMRIDTCRGTRKLSQNKPAEVPRLIAAMAASGGAATSDAMRAASA